MKSPLAAVRRFLADEPYRRMPDDELWARFRDHADGDSLRVILERVGGRLSARCRAITGDPALAEDALQETLLQLVRHRRRIGTYGQAVAWLYRVTDSRSRMIVRTRRRAWWRDWRAARPEAAAARPPTDFEAVTAAVARLPARERRAVELVYLEGMTHEQAAAALGVKRGSVGTYVGRGVKRLQAALGRPEAATLAVLATAGAGLGDGWASTRATEFAAAALRPATAGWRPLGLLAAGVGAVSVAGGVTMIRRPAPVPPLTARTPTPAESVADRSLRLFHADILPRQLAALGGQALSGGTVRLTTVTAYDSRIECWFEFAHRYPDGRPFFTTRLLLRHQSATGATQTVMDRFGNGQLRPIDPDRFLIIWTDDQVTNKEVTAASRPLKAAVAAFDVLPRDEAAKAASADASARFEAACRPLLGDWFAGGKRAARWTLGYGPLEGHHGLQMTEDKKHTYVYDRNWARVDDAGRLHGLEPFTVGLVTDAVEHGTLRFADRPEVWVRRPTD